MQQNQTDKQVSYYHAEDNSKRAYHAINQSKSGPHNPGIIFLAGHGSDMMGTKALAIEALAEQSGIPFLRFDYFGHGLSDGHFLEGNLSVWLKDCLNMLDGLTTGPQILVGSSLGGWLMIRTAQYRKDRIKGLIGIAAAPDFTETLIWNQLEAQQKRRMQQDGQIALPNPYAPEDVIYPLHLIEDGRAHLLLGDKIDLDIPVILHQGMADAEVPYETAIQLATQLACDNVQLLLHKSAGHRFSEPDEIQQLLESVRQLHNKIKSPAATAEHSD